MAGTIDNGEGPRMDENEQGGKYRGEPRWGRGQGGGDEGLKREGGGGTGR